MKKRPAVLFDIDGTLADPTHRRILSADGRLDWAKFNKNMDEDTPNKPIISLYKTLWESGRYEIIILSAREERFRKLTEQWLVWHEIPFGRLLMRADKDGRSDNLVKEDFLKQLISEEKEILFVVDDRRQVVDMWRANGITCLQCAEGNF